MAVHWIETGEKAPSFSLRDDRGELVRLRDFRGSPVILYFYPRDNTPLCTQQACALRDRHADFKSLGAVVLGVSTDSQESHAQFRDQHKLNFRLLVDSSHKVAEAYGAWREKNMYGKKVVGIQRSAFLIDESGKVVNVWKRVLVAGHDEKIVLALRSLVEPTD